MRKPELNFVIDTLAFFLFLFLVSTGFLIYLVMPPASGLSIWGMDRHGWGDIHFWIALTFLVFMAVHFILHWTWIKTKVKGKSKDHHITKTRSIIAILLILFVLFLLMMPFLSPVEKSSNEHGRHGQNVELIR
ncbi:MAG: DUF4405 domain-containing protein [Balneolaceae bacterium]|nr:DUF4405 domain-containing protein [Balneolaceae bacterium]